MTRLHLLSILALFLASCSSGATTTQQVLPPGPSGRSGTTCASTACAVPTSETLYTIYTNQTDGFDVYDIARFYNVQNGTDVPFLGRKTIGAFQVGVTSNRRFVFVTDRHSEGQVIDYATGTVQTVIDSGFAFSGDQRHIFFSGGSFVEASTIPPSAYISYDIPGGSLYGLAADSSGRLLFIPAVHLPLPGEQPFPITTGVQFFDTVQRATLKTVTLEAYATNPLYDQLSNQLYMIGDAGKASHLFVLDVASCELLRDITLPHFAFLTMTRTGKAVFVTDSVTRVVTRYAISANGGASASNTFTLDAFPDLLAVNEDGSHLFAHFPEKRTVEELDTSDGRMLKAFADPGDASVLGAMTVQ